MTNVIGMTDGGACGYWRISLPLSYVCSDHLQIKVDALTMVDVGKADVVVVGRLNHPQHLQTMKNLKSAGKKIVFDLDDDIFSVPEWNPAIVVHQPEHLDAARAIMDISDVITTTTEILADRIREQTKTPIKIIQNRININSYPNKSKYSNTGHYRVLWMGSQSHVKDLDMIRDPLMRFINAHDNVKFSIIGMLPDWVLKEFNDADPRIEFTNFFSNINTYIDYSKRVMADVAIAPLISDRFNMAKSNLKAQEYIAMNIPLIVSGGHPYVPLIDGNVGCVCDTADEWYEALERNYSMSKKSRERQIQRARDRVKREHEITQSAVQWEQLLLSL